MSLYCANCYEAKVFIDNTMKMPHRVRCERGLWLSPKTNDERTVSIVSMRTKHPPAQFTCPEYEPMGEGIKEFIDSLPYDKVDYENRWVKPKEVGRGKV